MVDNDKTNLESFPNSKNEILSNVVDSGSKDNTNFDEIISFNHTYLKFRLFEGLEEDKIPEFPFLMNHEYLLLGNLIIDEKSYEHNNRDTLKQVKAKVNSFNGDGDVSMKNALIENLGFYAKEIGFENTIDLLLPLITKIPYESDSIKLKFITNIKDFLDFLKANSEEGYKIIRDQVVPIISNILTQKLNDRIIEKTSETLALITNYIKDEDKGIYILTIVIMMAQDDLDETSRILAAKLFNILAPIIGRDLCEFYVVPQISSFANDPNVMVRNAITNNLINMCNSISQTAFKNKLIPAYFTLSNDSIWTVRKAAVEILPKIANFCEYSIISKNLFDMYLRFIKDENKYVKFSALEIIGRFIILIKIEDLKNNKIILEFYKNSIEEFYTNKDYYKDCSDFIYKCAYNFPAVLQVYGKDSWKELGKYYLKMAYDKNVNVRKSISSSIGEISNIIGKESTESDLLNITEKYYKEEGIEIRNLIMHSVPAILKNVDENYRYCYLEKLRRFLNLKEKWRTRMEYSKILSKFNFVYNDEITYKQVFPISLSFCTDDVGEVRFKAAKYCGRIIYQLLSGDIEYRINCVNIVKAFATSINFHFRQL